MPYTISIYSSMPYTSRYSEHAAAAKPLSSSIVIWLSHSQNKIVWRMKNYIREGSSLPAPHGATTIHDLQMCLAILNRIFNWERIVAYAVPSRLP